MIYIMNIIVIAMKMRQNAKRNNYLNVTQKQGLDSTEQMIEAIDTAYYKLMKYILLLVQLIEGTRHGINDTI